MARLSLNLLGSFEARVNGQHLAGFSSTKVRALLAYLVVESGRAHGRSELAGLLWPEQDQRTGLTYLRNALANLRGVLGDRDALRPYIRIEGSSHLRFDAGTDHRLDIAELQRLLVECEAHRPRCRSSCPACIDRLEGALALDRGAFLDGFVPEASAEFDSWVQFQRERAHQELLRALSWLGEGYERRGELATALRMVQRLVAMDPLREASHRQLMQVAVRSGDRSAALRQFEACRQMLMDDLGVTPETETLRLHERICAGQPWIGPRFSGIELGAADVFFGRETLRLALGERLIDPLYRLHTLLGPGGVGKSHLALAVASDLRGCFEDGLWRIDVLAIGDREELLAAVAGACDLPRPSETPSEATIAAGLKDVNGLLLLDGCEHLRAHCATLVVSLLRACPRLSILVTSSEALGIGGEQVIPVPAMDMQGLAEQAEAVRFFAARAALARPSFTLGPKDAETVAALCRRLDGLPFWIALLAARADRFSVQEMLEKLDVRLDWLDEGVEIEDGQCGPLRNRVAHRFDLLPTAERRVLRRLSIFPGEWPLDAAEILCASGDIRPQEVSKHVAALARRSLIDVRWRGGVRRLALYRYIRAFGLDKLEEAGESGATWSRLAAWSLELVTCDGGLSGAPPSAAWCARLDEEIGTLDAVLGWSLSESGDVREGLQLACALAPYWKARGQIEEGRGWLEALLVRADRQLFPTLHSAGQTAILGLAS